MKAVLKLFSAAVVGGLISLAFMILFAKLTDCYGGETKGAIFVVSNLVAFGILICGALSIDVGD